MRLDVIKKTHEAAVCLYGEISHNENGSYSIKSPMLPSILIYESDDCTGIFCSATSKKNGNIVHNYAELRYDEMDKYHDAIDPVHELINSVVSHHNQLKKRR